MRVFNQLSLAGVAALALVSTVQADAAVNVTLNGEPLLGNTYGNTVYFQLRDVSSDVFGNIYAGTQFETSVYTIPASAGEDYHTQTLYQISSGALVQLSSSCTYNSTSYVSKFVYGNVKDQCSGIYESGWYYNLPGVYGLYNPVSNTPITLRSVPAQYIDNLYILATSDRDGTIYTVYFGSGYVDIVSISADGSTVKAVATYETIDSTYGTYVWQSYLSQDGTKLYIFLYNSGVYGYGSIISIALATGTVTTIHSITSADVYGDSENVQALTYNQFTNEFVYVVYNYSYSNDPTNVNGYSQYSVNTVAATGTVTVSSLITGTVMNVQRVLGGNAGQIFLYTQNQTDSTYSIQQVSNNQLTPIYHFDSQQYNVIGDMVTGSDGYIYVYTEQWNHTVDQYGNYDQYTYQSFVGIPSSVTGITPTATLTNINAVHAATTTSSATTMATQWATAVAALTAAVMYA